MQDNRRDFIKKGASLAAALSVGGATSAMADAMHEKAKKAELAKAYIKDAGMIFSLSMPPGSPRIPYAPQIGVTGAVSGVMKVGDLNAWDPKAITATKESWEKLGLKWAVVEGPPSLGEQTKLALSGRDQEISNFITFMKNVKQYGGIDTICYNWMPVISWFRSKMDTVTRGGALVTSFDYEDIKNNPLTKYGEVSKESLWKNLEYFLKAVIPEAEKIGINLSLHPDDPQVDKISGISRIMTSPEAFDRMLNIVPSKYSNITMCQGNFSLMGADIPALVRRWGKAGKISFVHFRNVRDLSGKVPSTKFTEVFHDDGQIDMSAAMQAYYDIGFKGAIRPDHVPTMFGEENTKPGYMNLGPLFAIGYMRGLLESIAKRPTA